MRENQEIEDNPRMQVLSKKNVIITTRDNPIISVSLLRLKICLWICFLAVMSIITIRLLLHGYYSTINIAGVSIIVIIILVFVDLLFMINKHRKISPMIIYQDDVQLPSPRYLLKETSYIYVKENEISYESIKKVMSNNYEEVALLELTEPIYNSYYKNKIRITQLSLITTDNREFSINDELKRYPLNTLVECIFKYKDVMKNAP